MRHVYGMLHHGSRKHPWRDHGEFDFRYERLMTDAERVGLAISQVEENRPTHRPMVKAQNVGLIIQP